MKSFAKHSAARTKQGVGKVHRVLIENEYSSFKKQKLIAQTSTVNNIKYVSKFFSSK